MNTPRTLTIPQIWLAAVTITALILACTPSPEPHSVEYYLDDKDARLARLKACDNSPGTLRDDADCINARQAAIRTWSRPSAKPFDPSNSSGTRDGPVSGVPSDIPK